MRVPFADVDFARSALSVDRRRGVGKRGFARALRSADLESIAGRRKKCFHMPMDAWMRSGPLADAVSATRSSQAPLRQVLASETVDELLAAWQTGRLTWSRAWSLVALNSWLVSLGPTPSPRGLVLEDAGGGARR